MIKLVIGRHDTLSGPSIEWADCASVYLLLFNGIVDETRGGKTSGEVAGGL